MRKTVKAVAADRVIRAQLTGYRVDAGDLGKLDIEGGVKGYDHRDRVAEPIVRRLDSLQRRLIVQGGQLAHGMYRLNDRVVHKHGRVETWPAVHDSVTEGVDAGEEAMIVE